MNLYHIYRAEDLLVLRTKNMQYLWCQNHLLILILDLKETSPEEIQVPENNEISINYVHIREIFYQNKIFINDVFTFKVAFGIIISDDEIKPQTIADCRNRNDWPI